MVAFCTNFVTNNFVLYLHEPMRFNLTITASKLMAFLVLFGALALDLFNKDAKAFMFAIPFITAMIGVKQYLDNKKETNGTDKVTDK